MRPIEAQQLTVKAPFLLDGRPSGERAPAQIRAELTQFDG